MKKFSKEHQPASNGRKQKGYTLFNAYIKNLGYDKPSKADYLECMQYILSLDDNDYNLVKQSKQTPKFVKLLMECLENERLQGKMIMDIVNYVYPKSNENDNSDINIIIQPSNAEQAELVNMLIND